MRPPEQTITLHGHDTALRVFRAAFGSGRLPHAWLLSGPEGIGKATLAFRMARLVLGADDPESPAGRRISAGTHPDLLVIRRSYDEKRARARGEIVVEDVAPIQLFLRRTAAEAGWRVVVVDGADFLNRNAANALLKLVEEPPPRALIVLVASMPGRLLPTIRSRCRKLALQPLEEEAIRAVMQDLGVEDPGPLAELGGAPGRLAQRDLDDGGRIAAFVSALRTTDASHAFVMAQGEAIARQEGGLGVFAHVLSRDLARQARAAGQARQLRKAADLAETQGAIAAMLRETEALNLDKATAIQMAASMLARGKGLQEP